VLGGVALVGAALYTALNDPSRAGSRFPACPFHSLTGLWCPGCGLTRGVHQLLTGHPLAAMGDNVFVMFAVAAIALSWWGWLRRGWGRPVPGWPAWGRRAVSTALPVLLVAYGVARNIPAAPFRALAP
jgi:hypothetical protein